MKYIKFAIACFNASTKIDTEEYIGVNIYTTESVDEIYRLIINRKFIWESKPFFEIKKSVESKINKLDNPSPELDKSNIENKVKKFTIDTTTKELNCEIISNKPANPSSELDASSSEIKVKQISIGTSTNEFNSEEQNNVIKLKNKSEEN